MRVDWHKALKNKIFLFPSLIALEKDKTEYTSLFKVLFLNKV